MLMSAWGLHSQAFPTSRTSYVWRDPGIIMMLINFNSDSYRDACSIQNLIIEMLPLISEFGVSQRTSPAQEDPRADSKFNFLLV